MRFPALFYLVAGTALLRPASSTPISQSQEVNLLETDPVKYRNSAASRAGIDVAKEEKADCDCGLRRGKSEKIVGGGEAEVHEFPWRCALYVNTSEALKFFCGCSVLNDQWIMTAAHCTRAMHGRPLFINAGDHDLANATDSNNQFIAVGEVHQHPDYDFVTYNNDIALLKLSKPLELSETVGPICLPYKFQEEEFSQASVIASGWGTLKEGDHTTPTTLHKVELPVLSTAECQPYFNKGQITDNMLCTYNPGKDTCQGDSGGSIDYEDAETGRLYSIGVVSFGYGCGRDKRPGVYTKVSKYTKFIDDTTGAKLCRV